MLVLPCDLTIGVVNGVKLGEMPINKDWELMKRGDTERLEDIVK